MPRSSLDAAMRLLARSSRSHACASKARKAYLEPSPSPILYKPYWATLGQRQTTRLSSQTINIDQQRANSSNDRTLLETTTTKLGYSDSSDQSQELISLI